jgi:hypothetical protein
MKLEAYNYIRRRCFIRPASSVKSLSSGDGLSQPETVVAVSYDSGRAGNGMDDLIAALKVKHPELAGALQDISEIARAVDSLPFEPFFEPVSTVSLFEGKRHLCSIAACDVAALANHVAYACRARMRSLETPILREIHDGRLTASATLVRAHLETAGLAAHVFLTVTDAAKLGNTERLDEMMRKIYFGTALVKETKGTPELEQYLDLSDQCTLQQGSWSVASIVSWSQTRQQEAASACDTRCFASIATRIFEA